MGIILKENLTELKKTCDIIIKYRNICQDLDFFTHQSLLYQNLKTIFTILLGNRNLKIRTLLVSSSFWWKMLL